MSNSLTNITGPAARGAYILAVLGIIGPAAGMGAAKADSKAPPAKPAPAPAAHPAPAARPAAPAPSMQGARINNNNNIGHPVPNSITTNHFVGQPNRVIPPGQPNRPMPPGPQRPMPPGPQPHQGCCTPVGGVHPGPGPGPAPGTHVGAGGTVFTRDARGNVSHFYDPRSGMNVDHLPFNHTRSVTEHDGRRIVSYGNHGYEQRVYKFRNQEIAHRIYVDHGRTYARFYSPYAFHGVHMEAYRPSEYYSPGFYQWVGRPWTPVHYGWAWQSDPWYAYYGPYFEPAPVYSTPAIWLTDYMIAASLQSAYASQDAALQGNYGPPPAGVTPLSPDVRQQIANEVQNQMVRENAEAQANKHSQIPGGPVGLDALFVDRQPHVFVAGSDINTNDVSGRPCQITQGDVLQVRALPAGNDTFATATVLGSKGSGDCALASNVSVSLNDLQDMQNHMRETADEGLRELQARQGQDGIPPAPADAAAPPVSGAFVDAAPTPDPQVAGAIIAQANEADQAERSTGLRSMNLTPAQSAPATISAGESIANVVDGMGNPATILNLGAKQIYIYKDPGMKVTFVNGKVTAVD